MPKFTVPQAYQLLREVADAERDFRKKAEFFLAARDQLIAAFDGDPGIRRAGLAAAAGLSRSRVTAMLNHESIEGLDDDVTVPLALREAIEELRPDLGRIRTISTRVA